MIESKTFLCYNNHNEVDYEEVFLFYPITTNFFSWL